MHVQSWTCIPAQKFHQWTSPEKTQTKRGWESLYPWKFRRKKSFTPGYLTDLRYTPSLLNTKARKNKTHGLLKFHMIFLIIPGNSTSFLLEPWNFLPFLQYSCKFHVFDPLFGFFLKQSNDFANPKFVLLGVMI